MFKRFLEVLAVFSLVASSAWAGQKNDKVLKVHAKECIQKLTVLASPENAPDQYLKAGYQNDSLFLYFDETHTAEVKNILEKWTEECSDLFDKKVYSSKFFSASPLLSLLRDETHKQAVDRTKAINNDSLAKEQKKMDEVSGSFNFRFDNGILQSIMIFPKKGKRYQFVKDGVTYLWGGNGVVHMIQNEGGFLKKDTVKVISGYEVNEKPWKHAITKEEYPSLNESVLDGKIEYDQEAFTAVSHGSVAKNKILKLLAMGGINFGYLTNPHLNEFKANRDSSALIEGLLEAGFDWEITAGIDRCSGETGTCLGFGAGYAAYVWALSGDAEKDPWGNYQSEDVTTVVHGIRLYGDYFFKSGTAYGIREAINIPLNVSMKFLESRTSIFVENGLNRFEVGLALSPVQFIPTLFFNIGVKFKTPTF